MIAANRIILAFAVAVALAPTASAQQRGNVREAAQKLGPPRDEQTQLFRGLLHHFKITPVDPRLEALGEGTITIVLGDPGRNRAAAMRYVRNTLIAGGAVLIASDSRSDLSDCFPDQEDVRIVGLDVIDPDGENSYRGNPRLPFAVPYAVNPNKLTEEEKLFAGLTRIATNGPGSLRIAKSPPYLRRTVARFPDTARFAVGDDPKPLAGNDSFAAAGVGTRQGDPFRCVVMADPSVLANDMLYTSADTTPTDNFAFAVRLVPWLQGPQKRAKCLFIENGEVVSKFDEFDFAQSQSPPIPPLPTPKLPDPMDRKFQEGASKAVSEVAGKLEDGPAYRKSFSNPANYLGALSLLVGALVILGGILLFFRIRGAILGRTFQPIPADPLRLGHEVALGSFTHRRLELLRGNDFRTSFAEYVRLLYTERGLPAGYAGARCPKVVAEGKNRRYIVDTIRRLWEESRIEEPLAYSKWKELEPILAAVRSAPLADRWRFAPTQNPNESEGAA